MMDDGSLGLLSWQGGLPCRQNSQVLGWYCNMGYRCWMDDDDDIVGQVVASCFAYSMATRVNE